jgi:hypothetical protein
MPNSNHSQSPAPEEQDASWGDNPNLTTQDAVSFLEHQGYVATPAQPQMSIEDSMRQLDDMSTARIFDVAMYGSHRAELQLSPEQWEQRRQRQEDRELLRRWSAYGSTGQNPGWDQNAVAGAADTRRRETVTSTRRGNQERQQRRQQPRRSGRASAAGTHQGEGSVDGPREPSRSASPRGDGNRAARSRS